MKTTIFSTVLLLIILSTSVFAGTDYFVDCSATRNGNGSFSNPYNSLSAVNSAKNGFSVGDGLYFKVGTKCSLTSDADRLRITWSGTSDGNRANIGAYHGDGQLGLGGYSRPIINGNQSYPNDYQGGISIEDRSYVTVKDLRFENIGKDTAKSPKAVKVTDSSNINVENCYFFRSSYGSIEYGRVNTGIIRNNVVEESGYPNWAASGAAIEITAANVQGATTNILVARNKIFNSKHEGIGLYKNVTNCIVEYNIVRDVRSYFIYNGASKYNIYRYNLVYETLEDIHKSFTSPRSSYAFASDIEGWRTGDRFNGENEWYGNIIGGTRRGFSFSCSIKSGDNDNSIVCHPNEKVYNNTIVDTDAAFNFSGVGSGDNIDVKNNISLIATEGIGLVHVGVGGYNVSGVTWNNNLFRGGPTVTGNAATKMIVGSFALAKSSGWRNISGELSGREFFPEIDSSAINNAGVNIIPNKAWIYEADYNSNPIEVKIRIPSEPVIGALVLNKNYNMEVPFLSPVKNVVVAGSEP